MKSITLTINLPDDANCPHCLHLIDIDETQMEIFIGDCPDCGTELILTSEDVEWGASQ